MNGILYIVSTPIGNLNDLSPRVLSTLSEVSAIYAETPEIIRKLLSAGNITGKPVQRLREFEALKKSPAIIAALRSGKNIALVSDAGTPGISDPGSLVADQVLRSGLPVRVIPGPSAVTTALAACGFRAEQFVFLGFLPGRDSRKRKLLSRAGALEVPIVIFESPHQIVQTITLIGESLPHRTLFLGREMTKLYEQFFRGTFTEVLATLRDGTVPARGEFTIVLGPGDAQDCARAENGMDTKFSASRP